MKFVLCVRKVGENDLGPSTPFVPDEEDYYIYLTAFVEELSLITGIVDVVQSGATILIESSQIVDTDELKRMIRPAFSAEAMQHLRFVSLLQS